MYIRQIGRDEHFIWKNSFHTTDAFSLINVLPPFYRKVIISFNKAKSIKPFKNLSKHEVIQQPIWCNEYIQIGSTCLYFKGWLKKGIMYVKDLINKNGTIKSENDMLECTNDMRNIFQEIFMIKNYVVKKLWTIDVSIGPHVNIRNVTHILHGNKLHQLKDTKNKTFYKMLMARESSREHMESIYARDFFFKVNVYG